MSRFEYYGSIATLEKHLAGIGCGSYTPEVQKFVDSLQGFRARKGIFITTSTFTKKARDFVEKIDSRIILIDGDRLTKLMIENNVGVTSLAIYEVKKIDSDFFTDA